MRSARTVNLSSALREAQRPSSLYTAEGDQRLCSPALLLLGTVYTLQETGSVDRLGGGLLPAAILLKRYPYMPPRVCILVLSSHYCPAFYPEAHKLGLINNCIPLLGELIDDTVPFYTRAYH